MKLYRMIIFSRWTQAAVRRSDTNLCKKSVIAQNYIEKLQIKNKRH